MELRRCILQKINDTKTSEIQETKDETLDKK